MSVENEQLETHKQIELRKEKLKQMREQGIAYPNDFRFDACADELHQAYDEKSVEELESLVKETTVAGRMMTRRLMGKASFIHVQDMSGKIQVYLRRDDLQEGLYQTFKNWDLGDIVGVTGTLFKTKTGELSVKASDIRLLTKALRPLPDKYHGLADIETRYRQRYLDLIANEKSRHLFRTRPKLITGIRHFLEKKRFIEVETPMMHTLAGGAAARPFTTHHQALDMDLFLRIAPELYLKRLVIGGFERVYEINRNFRNEGLSARHNPEFTMLEFYQAYANYHDLMNLTEELLQFLAQEVLGTMQLTYQNEKIDLSLHFPRMTMFDSILQFNNDISAEDLSNIDKARAIAKKLDIAAQEDFGLGKIQTEIFEKTVEKQLIQPTFITEYPTEVSPLARRNDKNQFVTDRFEFFVGGQELANGFSELNDPEDQAERFRAQLNAREKGGLETMPYDEDYITALEYGMPPTAGEGIGIDRLTMVFTDSASIRDVILFPLMRPI